LVTDDERSHFAKNDLRVSEFIFLFNKEKSRYAFKYVVSAIALLLSVRIGLQSDIHKRGGPKEEEKG